MDDIWPQIRDAITKGEWNTWSVIVAMAAVLYGMRFFLEIIKLVFEIIDLWKGLRPKSPMSEKPKIMRPKLTEIRRYGKPITHLALFLLLSGSAMIMLQDSGEKKALHQQVAVAKSEAEVSRAENATIKSKLAAAVAFESRFSATLGQIDGILRAQPQNVPPPFVLADLQTRTQRYQQQLTQQEFKLNDGQKQNEFRQYLQSIQDLVNRTQRGHNTSPGQIEELRAIRQTMQEALAALKSGK
jgi:hypothetical protein